MKKTGKTQRNLEASDPLNIEVAVSVCASADGGEIAYICEQADAATDQFARHLWVLQRSSLAKRRTELAGHARMCFWAPDGSLIVVVDSFDAREGVKLVRLAKDGLAAIAQLPTVPNAMALSADGRQLTLGMIVPEAKVTVALPEKPVNSNWSERAFYTERVDWRLDGAGVQDGYVQVFRLDMASGKLDQLTEGVTPSGYYSAGLAWNLEGSHILFVSNLHNDWHKEPFNTNIYSLDCTTKQIAPLTTRFGVDLEPKRSPKGDWIAYRGFDDNGEFQGVQSLYLMRPDDSGAFCLANVGQGIGTHVWADDRLGLYVHYVRDASLRLAYVGLDGAVQEIGRDLAEGGAFDIEPYLIGNASLAAVPGGVVTIVTAAHDPSQLVEFGRSGQQRLLAQMNEDSLGAIKLGQMENLPFQATDGTQLQTWVLHPPDFDPHQTYPLILELHGGPSASYGGQFSYRFQRYASEGYVVVAPNYRGSLGLDMAFCKSGRWVFPGLEYDDVMAAMDAVLALTKIDMNRLYVAGVSAGGLLSLG